ncbi:MAG: glycerophosphoryl diester phosphodiesterase [Rhodospirillales bacterium]|nr:MAG: glycerophosphoryl diester phosphodiesterase [Rhodospirillales bacterium]
MNRDLRWPRLIGHRGALRLAPENTLASFFCAREAGALWVELDVRLSRDRVPVVFHDARLERTSNGKGRVIGQSLEQLKRLDAGSWFGPQFRGQSIPTLEEALLEIARLGLGVNIEIKPDPGLESETARLALETAARIWPADAPLPLISSFKQEALKQASGMGIGWPLGYLAERFSQEALAKALALKVSTFNLNEKHIKPAQAALIHQAGLGVMAYTVNDPARARHLWAMGVDSLFTDNPKVLSAG